MIVIPMGTDAPIYHWPYATVGMMLLNVVLLFAVPPTTSEPTFDENNQLVTQAETNYERYSLTLGDGLHPVQWVTHNFLHIGIGHLIGNLLFLWAFGLVVEGKLGAFKYLLMYLTIGTLHGASIQTLMLGSSTVGHALGASAVVYGLLATCMIWAPRNEVTCTIIFPAMFRLFVFQKEFYYTTVAMFYVGGQMFGLALRGGLLGQFVISELGHLSGATWGAVVAIALLKLNLVDCEDWDVFSVWTKHRQLGRQWKARGARLDHNEDMLRKTLRAQAKARKQLDRREPSAAGDESVSEDRSTSAVNRVLKQVEGGDFDAALASYAKYSHALPYWPSQGELYAIIKGFHAKQAIVESLRPMRDHCRRFPAASDKMRLKLAQVLIRDRQRPMEALQVLEELPAGSLSPDLERFREALTRQAMQMQEDGVLELEVDD